VNVFLSLILPDRTLNGPRIRASKYVAVRWSDTMRLVTRMSASAGSSPVSRARTQCCSKPSSSWRSASRGRSASSPAAAACSLQSAPPVSRHVSREERQQRAQAAQGAPTAVEAPLMTHDLLSASRGYRGAQHGATGYSRARHAPRGA